MTTPTEALAGRRTRPRARATRAAPPGRPPVHLRRRGPPRRSARERDEPAWLRDDRLSAAAAFERLPIETNELYTTYVDLRAADLFAARPYVRTATAPAAPGELPEGADGVIEMREDASLRLALAPALAGAGVILETARRGARPRRGGVREALTATALPADEKLAQLVRGFWSQGIHLHVPDGVGLEQPIVLRWAVGGPDRASSPGP